MLRRFLVLTCMVAVCYGARPAPDVPIPTTDGKTLHFKQYHGKVVLFMMMLTRCVECVQTVELLGKLQKEYGPRGFQVITVSLDEDAGAANSFVQRYRPPFPFGHLSKDAAITVGAMAPDAHPIVPVLLFIDWMGNVRFQYYGDNAFLQKDAEKNIRSIADGLLRQAANKEGPTYKTEPAKK